MCNFNPEVRIRVIVNDILPDIRKKPNFFSSDYKFNLLQKSLELAEETNNPLFYSMLLRELFNGIISEEMAIYC